MGRLHCPPSFAYILHQLELPLLDVGRMHLHEHDLQREIMVLCGPTIVPPEPPLDTRNLYLLRCGLHLAVQLRSNLFP